MPNSGSQSSSEHRRGDGTQEIGSSAAATPFKAGAGSGTASPRNPESYMSRDERRGRAKVDDHARPRGDRSKAHVSGTVSPLYRGPQNLDSLHIDDAPERGG